MTKEKLKVLAIEDNLLCAELLTKKLKGVFSLEFAHSLADGLKMLDGTQWDCVLLDLGLHDAVKENVFDLVQANSGHAAIIILTGHSDPRLRDFMLTKHADGFAVKGVEDSGQDLMWIIQRAIEFRKTHD